MTTLTDNSALCLMVAEETFVIVLKPGNPSKSTIELATSTLDVALALVSTKHCVILDTTRLAASKVLPMMPKMLQALYDMSDVNLLLGVVVTSASAVVAACKVAKSVAPSDKREQFHISKTYEDALAAVEIAREGSKLTPG